MYHFENPLEHFSSLYTKWLACSTDSEASWVTLSTSNQQGKVNSRVILLKKHCQKGFFFVTNFSSTKSQELRDNPYASLCFFWDALGQQVRLRGRVEFATEVESDTYWQSRGRGSQIGAYASKQSQKLSSKEDLLASLEELKEKFYATEIIPRPEFWGGFWVIPEEYDFWKKQEDRLHDRILYTKNNANDWEKTLLFP